MDQRLRARLGFNGLAIVVASLAIAIPFAMVFTKGDDEHTHLWSVAHLEALTHGLLLMGLAAMGHLVVLSRAHERIAVGLVVTGAWASITGATIGAIWDVLGVKPGTSVANTSAWVFLGYGTVAVSGALVWMLWGAHRGYEATVDPGHPATNVVTLPQFGADAHATRYQAVLDVTRWENWGRTQVAQPVRIERPRSISELRTAIQTASADGLRIKAVGGGYSWSAVAVTNGVLIDMSNLDRPIGMTPPSTERPATITVEAGMTVHSLTEHAARLGLTLATTTVIPWVQVGGAIANGCHGAGRDVATMSDEVCALDVVGPDGAVTHYERDDSDTWRALTVNLGALGIVYSVTFECVPIYDAHALDTVMPMVEAVGRLGELATANEAFELFWFPFNENALVKTWNRSDQPCTEHLPRRAWDDLVQAFEQELAHPIRRALLDDPSFTPSLCRMMFDLMPKVDVVCPLPWAMQYSTSFAPVIDTSYAIPIDDGYRNVTAAWDAGVSLVEEWARDGRYPQNMVLHARFVGRPSSALLSPTEGHTLGSCLIEALTFENTTGHQEYFADLGARWQALGGRPHWAKLVYHPTDFAALYGENLVRFRAVRERLDPEGVFLNDFLDGVLDRSSTHHS